MTAYGLQEDYACSAQWTSKPANRLPTNKINFTRGFVCVHTFGVRSIANETESEISLSGNPFSQNMSEYESPFVPRLEIRFLESVTKDFTHEVNI